MLLALLLYEDPQVSLGSLQFNRVSLESHTQLLVLSLEILDFGVLSSLNALQFAQVVLDVI